MMPMRPTATSMDEAEDGAAAMKNTNDNARIFDQIERYLTEVDAALDVEAGLRRLRLRMAELTESSKEASGAATAETHRRGRWRRNRHDRSSCAGAAER